MGTKTSIIPSTLHQYYEQKAYYGFLACLRELNSNSTKLSEALQNRDYTVTRQILHAMEGTTKIIQNNQLLHQIETMRASLQEKEETDDNHRYLLRTMNREIQFLREKLREEQHSVDLLIYAESYLFNDNLMEKLTSWSFSNQVERCNELSEIGHQIRGFLPDIVLLIGLKTKILFDDEIIKVKRTFPGTSFLFLDGMKSWDKEVHFKKLEKTLRDSLKL